MAKVKNPISFSKYFATSASELTKLGVFDPILNVDTKLFVDPLLLFKSSHKILAKEAYALFQQHFSDVALLLEHAKEKNDLAFKEAVKKLSFRETSATCLGYGAHGISGSAFGPEKVKALADTAHRVIELGIKDPRLFLLIPLIQEGVGPDLIGDLTIHVCKSAFAKFTEQVAAKLKVPCDNYTINQHTFSLPTNPTSAKKCPVILVPLDVLRELPIAKDWDSVADAAHKNEVLRNTINREIGRIWTTATRKDKAKLKAAILGSKEGFEALLSSLFLVPTTPYDPDADTGGHLIWRPELQAAKTNPLQLQLPSKPSPSDIFEVVKKIIEQFKFLMEHRGVNKLLWHKRKRRPEKSSQMLFFAIAHSYCMANNIDISPEVDTGTGEVDFKFSLGFNCRVVIEIKLSTNSKIVSGYKHQLEAYKKSEATDFAVYLVIDVGGMGKKDEVLTKARNQILTEGARASELYFVDGMIHPSASKRS